MDLYEAPPEKDPWHRLTTAQLFEELGEYPWLVKGLHLAPGRITLLNGYADTGKTVVAMTIALGVATGRPIWGVYAPSRAGKVLHLNGEIGSHITKERYQRLARGMSVHTPELIATNNLTVAMHPEPRLDDPDFELKLEEACAGHALVIIDSLRAFSGALDENSKGIGQALLILARVSDKTGATIMVLHHTRKPSKEHMGGSKMDISGSGSILGGAEAAFVLEAQGPGLPLKVVHARSPLGRPLLPFGLRIQDVVGEDGDHRWGLEVVHIEGEQAVEEAEVAKAREEAKEHERIRAEVRALMLKHNGLFEGTQADIAKMCKASKERVNAVLRELQAEGSLERVAGRFNRSVYKTIGVGRD